MQQSLALYEAREEEASKAAEAALGSQGSQGCITALHASSAACCTKSQALGKMPHLNICSHLAVAGNLPAAATFLDDNVPGSLGDAG